jgi:hypothetical protein
MDDPPAIGEEPPEHERMDEGQHRHEESMRSSVMASLLWII